MSARVIAAVGSREGVHVEDIRYISVMDDAIDRARSKLRGDDGYEGTQKREHLVMLPGRSPVIFVLRPLDWHGRRFVARAEGIEQKTIHACIVGLDSIEGYAPRGPGIAWTGTQRLKLSNAPERSIWHDYELAAVEEEFGTPLLHELASVLMQRAERGNAWGGSARPYTLPRYLWDVAAASVPQPAE